MNNSIYCLVLLILLGFSGCKKEEEKIIERPAIEVSVYQLTDKQTENNIPTQNYAGVTSPHDYVDIVPQISGTILSLTVKDGQYINKGQVLARIDNEMYRNQAEVQQAQLKYAQEAYQRIKQVYEKGSIAEIKYLEAKSNYEQAQAAVKASKFPVSKSIITSPRSGYVSGLTAVQGSLAGEGQFLMRIVDIQQLDILVSISANEIHQFKNGLGAQVYFPTLENKMVNGRVTDVSMFSPTGTPTYTVKVRVQNNGQQIRPGMNAKVEFDLPTAVVLNEQKKFIPAQAVQLDNKNQNFVYVYDVQKKNAVKKPVTLGATTGDLIEITSGLNSNESIITSGFQKITNETKVIIKK